MSYCKVLLLQLDTVSSQMTTHTNDDPPTMPTGSIVSRKKHWIGNLPTDHYVDAGDVKGEI